MCCKLLTSLDLGCSGRRQDEHLRPSVIALNPTRVMQNSNDLSCVYLFLWRRTHGVGEEDVQIARASITAVPVYSVLRRWRRQGARA